MSEPKIFTTKSRFLSAESFYPRNYDPVYLFVKNKLKNCGNLEDFLVEPVSGGSTPPYYFFLHSYENGIPFIKTSAIIRDLINVNDLFTIDKIFHKASLKRSITKPYDVIFSMTGKFMGKAALCPPTIEEMNMSQNSVVLKTHTPEQAAFLCIFLNSPINQQQIKGIYSITKQKYINQGKIGKLKLINYEKSFFPFLTDYIDGINNYYNAISKIQEIINKVNKFIKLNSDFLDIPKIFHVTSKNLTKRILLPSYYRNDFNESSKLFLSNFDNATKIQKDLFTKGDEIGSSNYEFDGIPFIKTSDIVNFDVDYEPNYYCSEAVFNEQKQDLHLGDILFTKDGKVGEVALVQGTANIVFSSGLVKYTPKDELDRYWTMLLLSSNWGKMFFNKWCVTASTMTHLRKDFFEDFSIPIPNEEFLKFITDFKNFFVEKGNAYQKIISSKSRILEKMYNEEIS